MIVFDFELILFVCTIQWRRDKHGNCSNQYSHLVENTDLFVNERSMKNGTHIYILSHTYTGWLKTMQL